MSPPDNETKHSPQNLNIKVHKYGGNVKVKIEFELKEDEYFDKCWIKNRLEVNASWMVKHLYLWSDCDSCYSINLFVDALHHLGKGLIRWNNHINSVKCSRRCLAAASMLKTAYHYKPYYDKSYRNWSNSHEISWSRLKKGYSKMNRKCLYDNAMGMNKEEYSKKMWDIIFNRQEKIESQRKKEAWAFIHKYIEHWWD